MFGRKFFVGRAVAMAWDHWDEFTDKLSVRLGEEWGPLANGLLDRAAFEVADLFGFGGALSGESIISRREIAHAALDMVTDNAATFLDDLNEKVDVPLLSDAMEEALEQKMLAGITTTVSACRSWIDENL